MCLGIIHLFLTNQGQTREKKKWAELFCTAYNNSPCAHLMLLGVGEGQFSVGFDTPLYAGMSNSTFFYSPCNL
jgi:hypothetical protein